MTIIETIKSSLKIIALNPSLALIFVLFFLVFGFLFPYIFTVKNIFVFALLTLCVLFFMISFWAGWLGLIKNVVKSESVCEKPFLVFFEEIGKNVISIGVAAIFYFVVMLVGIAIASKISISIFENLNDVMQNIMSNVQNPAEINDYILKLPQQDKNAFLGFYLAIMLVDFIINFLFLFYPAALYDEIKANIFIKPFVAFKKAILFTFKRIFKSIGFYFVIGLLNFTLIIVSQFLGMFKFVAWLNLILYIYFVIAVIVLIFNYYERNNNSDRCDCVGENIICDKISEED